MSLHHTLFLDFLKLFVNKLSVSANFMILEATVQKLWVFEVFGQGLARAGMC
jgi:hypothetical protein